MKFSSLGQLRALLRAALETAERCDEPLIWAQIGQVFGHVCHRIRLMEAAAPASAEPPTPGDQPHVTLLDERRMLGERLLETIAAAEHLDEPRAVLHLRAAMATLSRVPMPARSAND